MSDHSHHAPFPRGEDADVEAHVVEVETGDESIGLREIGAEARGEETEADRERLQREARRAYQAAGGVTVVSTKGVVPPPGPTEPPETEGTSPGERGASDELPPETAEAEAPPQSPEYPGPDVSEIARERDEYLDALRRVQADFENYRKRIMKQESATAERATESLVNKLLPVLDTVDLARLHTQKGQPVEDAVTMIAVGIAEVLAKEGLERIDPEGESFDPLQHEAVAHEPTEGPGDGPVVIEVMRAGYRWKGRVLRPAMVKVRG